MAQDYKKTLNLPETDFAMQADFPNGSPACWSSGRRMESMRS